MKIWGFCTLALFGFLMLTGQIIDPPQDDQNDPDDPHPPLALPLSIVNLTSLGVNYHALAPKEGGPFVVTNLGGLPASLLLVSEPESGQVVKQIELPPGQRQTIDPEPFGADVCVVSLQPFQVHTDHAFTRAGVTTHQPVVNPPSRPVQLVPVLMLDGTKRTVAVTRDQQAYYPVYIHRQAIGEWRAEEGVLLMKHGLSLEGFLEK